MKTTRGAKGVGAKNGSEQSLCLKVEKSSRSGRTEVLMGHYQHYLIQYVAVAHNHFCFC